MKKRILIASPSPPGNEFFDLYNNVETCKVETLIGLAAYKLRVKFGGQRDSPAAYEELLTRELNRSRNYASSALISYV